MRNKTDYLWNFFGGTGSQAIYLLVNLILARYLTPYDFGTIGVLSIFLSTSDILIDSGLGGSLIKEKEISETDCSTIFVFNESMAIVLYFLLFFFAPLIETFFRIENLTYVIRIISLVFLINALRLVPSAILARNMRFKQMAIMNTIAVIVAGTISIVAARFGFGVYALVAYTLTRSIVLVIGYCKIVNYSINVRFSKQSFKKLYSFGLYTSLSNIIDTVYESITTLFFGRFLSISSAGFLSQAKKLEDAGTRSIANTINNVSFPVLVKYRTNLQLFISEANAIYKIVILFVTPLFLSVGLYANVIISLLYGREWLPAAPYLTILIFAAIFMIMETITRNYIKSLGEVSRLFKITIIKRVIGIISIICFCFISVDLILWGYVIGAAIGYIMNTYLYSKLTSTRLSKLFIKHFIFILPSIIYYVIR